MTDVASYGVEERCNRLQVIQPDSVALTSRSGLISQVGGSQENCPHSAYIYFFSVGRFYAQ